MLPKAVRQLTQLLSRLPGVGEKTAMRYAMHLLLSDTNYTKSLAHALASLSEQITTCDNCSNLCDRVPDGVSICSVCADASRSNDLLCVVHTVQDLHAIERSGAMSGRYFILGKLLSPLDGIGTDALPLAKLRERIAQDATKELILATPASVDGEATAMLLLRELEAFHSLKISRIASGIPHGGELEYADQITLGRAIAGRRNFES